MKSPLDVTFNTQVRKNLDDFHLSLQQGNAAVSSFLGTLSNFNNTLQKNRNKLQQETLVTVHRFASLINFYASNLLELDMKAEAKGKESMADISEILSEEMGKLSIEDAAAPLKEASLPAYVEPSYSWLLSNLHNPYPTKEVKRRIASQTNCSVKDIDAWFIDVRKRIGWNALRKSRFGNKQDKIIFAATQIFSPTPLSFADDLNTALGTEVNAHDNHRPFFLAIQRKAKALYVDRFPSSVPLAPTNNAIRTRSDPIVLQSPSSTLSLDGSSSYPTPEPSPSNFFYETSPSPGPQHHDAISSPMSRKRNLDSSDVCGVDNDPSPPSKRLRSAVDDTVTSPVSPLLEWYSNNESVNPGKKRDENIVIPLVNPTSVATEIPTLKRKRRLSDGENQGSPKRPHNAFCVPRLQTVSDPLPDKRLLIKQTNVPQPLGDILLEHRFSDSIPAPANVHTSISVATPVDVNLYQYDLSSPGAGDHLSGFTPSLDDQSVEPDPLDLIYGEPIFSSSGFDTLPFPSALQDVCVDPIDPSNIQFTLDPPSSFHFDCNQSNGFDDVGIFSNSELFSLATGVFPDQLSLLNNGVHPVSTLQPDPFTFSKAPVISKSNHTVQPDRGDEEDKEARRARAHALRQELAQLVAEGL